MTERPQHSPLGASSAERWMRCPGSVALLRALKLAPSDDADYRIEGTAAHAVAAKCLEENGDAWEHQGLTVEGAVVDDKMVDAVQVYLDECRPLIAEATAGGGQHYIEFPVSSPVHPLFYGTLDFGTVVNYRLRQRDYKNGMLLVEVENNPQFMYYVFGLLQLHEDVREVELGVVQPNAFHVDGPVRTWSVSAEYIHEWVHETLVPAMHRAEMDDYLEAGDHCRFCPAKLICPALTGLFQAACVANPKDIVHLDDARVGRNYQHIQGVRFYLKALEEETLRRLSAGHAVPGTKLVAKRANRVWKSQAADEFKLKFGSEVFTKPELKSPAEMEKLGAVAKALVKEWAFTPQSGMTVALENDSRIAIKVQTTQEAFGPAVEKLLQEETE